VAGAEDEEELETYADSVQRLRDADEITRAMTREEYVHYSECRQASFTYRKAKRFREWANMASYIDMKPNDDIIDILGFLTFEIVSTLTEGAMRVKLDLVREKKGGGEQTAGTGGVTSGGVTGGPGSGVAQGETGEVGKKRKRVKEDIGGDGEEGVESDEEGAASGKVGLFSLPSNEQTPHTYTKRSGDCRGCLSQYKILEVDWSGQRCH